MYDPLSPYYSGIHISFLVAFYGIVFVTFKHFFDKFKRLNDKGNEHCNCNDSYNNFAIRFIVSEALIDEYLDEDIISGYEQFEKIMNKVVLDMIEIYKPTTVYRMHNCVSILFYNNFENKINPYNLAETITRCMNMLFMKYSQMNIHNIHAIDFTPKVFVFHSEKKICKHFMKLQKLSTRRMQKYLKATYDTYETWKNLGVFYKDNSYESDESPYIQTFYLTNLRKNPQYINFLVSSFYFMDDHDTLNLNIEQSLAFVRRFKNDVDVNVDDVNVDVTTTTEPTTTEPTELTETTTTNNPYLVSVGNPLNLDCTKLADMPKSAVSQVYQSLKETHPLDVLSNVVFSVTDITGFQGCYRVDNSEDQVRIYDFDP